MTLLVAGTTTIALSAEYRVNSNEDFPHWHQGSGVCEIAPQTARCTLRAAIMEANAHPGEDRIVIPAGVYRLSFAGSVDQTSAIGDLDVTDDLLIEGAGATKTILDGLGLDRVLDIHGAQVTVTGLSIRNGDTLEIAEPGGAIRNSGTLTLTRVRVSASQGIVDLACTSNSEAAASSSTCDVSRSTGAISNTGSLKLVDVTVNGQSVASEGAAN